MESTLPLPFFVGVDIPPGLASSDGLKRDEVACLAAVFLEAQPKTLEKFGRFLKQHNAGLFPYIDASRLESKDDIVSLIDGGARKVFVRPERLAEFAEFGSRVAPVLSAHTGLQNATRSATEHGLLITDFNASEAEVGAFMEKLRVDKLPHLMLKPAADANLDEFLTVAQHCSAVPIIPSTLLTTDKDDKSKLHLTSLLSRYWSSDRADRLIPTVVVNESGVALGLVYSSPESVAEAIRTKSGVYQSRKRGLWHKGLTSGDTQELVRVNFDCDNDTIRFTVIQKGRFCHLDQHGCFGDLRGIPKLEQTLRSRKENPVEGSYTARLFADAKLLRAKIKEEAEELCDAETPDQIAFEAADLIYFALTRAVSAGVSLADIERNLDAKSFKVMRRKGDAKPKFAEAESIAQPATSESQPAIPASAPGPAEPAGEAGRITMKRYNLAELGERELNDILKRPSQKSYDATMSIVKNIIDEVIKDGDKAVLRYTHKFEKATSLTSPVLKAPFPEELMRLPPETKEAIDTSFDNIYKFHAAQKEEKPLQVETMPGVMCSRFARPIEAVGLYIPGGTAVLPSTAMMLGIPAMVACCKKIVFASPPREDGSVTPEIVYIAHRVGAESIVLAGGAQAVAAMAYGTESVTKVDKILGPGNQFVTAAKMYVSNDTSAGVSIDMPAGPSEVLVIADKDANAAFVASDLLSQAEHGVDSQVVLIAIDLDEAELQAIENELHEQAMALPRVDIVRGAIAHSVTIQVKNVEEALAISNRYAPEHLILQLKDVSKAVELVQNAGSVFIGQWTPESVGDYSAGVNHSLRKQPWRLLLDLLLFVTGAGPERPALASLDERI